MYSIILREIIENNETDGILVKRREETSAAYIPLIGQWLSLIDDETEVVYEIVQISYPLWRNGESVEIYIKRLGDKEEVEGTLTREDEL
ncbi:hypothetical protein GCM10023206_07390 [Acinetobacter puyangensis]|uniref:Uncharacterized protein n=1 Tax=Acinetobacter puyangensis TaxID=1096779 RepID=A0A240E6P5_9GAMM|nr:hypothetical protein [Acinetobacter puyangensis]SNX44181.1 hypothetical protein SAMN05421731_102342 [Acinetobacter puyangensis]